MTSKKATRSRSGEPGHLGDGLADGASTVAGEDHQPPSHRTVDRVTQILETVTYNPGMTFAELARALNAPKSSVYGFMQGLLGRGWLYEQQRRFYLGPAVYGLTLVAGQIRAGMVGHSDLVALHRETGVPVFLGVAAGDHLIYIAEATGDTLTTVDARSNIRRTLIATAGGKALLAARSDAAIRAYIRRRNADDADAIETFIAEYEDIRRTRIARNSRLSGSRYAIGTVIPNKTGDPVAAVTLTGPTTIVKPQARKLAAVLLRHVDQWTQRSITAREVI